MNTLHCSLPIIVNFFLHQLLHCNIVYTSQNCRRENHQKNIKKNFDIKLVRDQSMQRLTMSCLFLKKIFNILNYLQSHHNFNQILISYYTRIAISIMEYIWCHSLQTTIHVFVICNNFLTLSHTKNYFVRTPFIGLGLSQACVSHIQNLHACK